MADRRKFRAAIVPRGREYYRVSTADDRPQCRVGVQDTAGEILEEMGLIGVDAEMAQLHLGLRPRQCGGALKCCWIVVLVGQVERLVARLRDQRREGDPRGGARREP